MAETDVIAPARRVRDAAVEAGIAIGFVSVIVGVLRTSALVAPLSKLARATIALASGDASVPLPAPGSAREIDLVVGAFSDMRDRVTAWTIASDDARASAELALEQRSAAFEELQQTRDDVVRRERLHAIGQVATGLAHDFHGAISTIAGYCEIILGHPAIRKDDQRLTEVIGRMHQTSLNASALVDRIRVLSLPSPVPRAPNAPHDPVSLTTVAEEALRSVEPSIARNEGRGPVAVT
jgi:signal transduction histidine kinase